MPAPVMVPVPPVLKVMPPLAVRLLGSVMLLPVDDKVSTPVDAPPRLTLLEVVIPPDATTVSELKELLVVPIVMVLLFCVTVTLLDESPSVTVPVP